MQDDRESLAARDGGGSRQANRVIAGIGDRARHAASQRATPGSTGRHPGVDIELIGCRACIGVEARRPDCLRCRRRVDGSRPGRAKRGNPPEGIVLVYAAVIVGRFGIQEDGVVAVGKRRVVVRYVEVPAIPPTGSPAILDSVRPVRGRSRTELGTIEVVIPTDDSDGMVSRFRS